MQHMPLSVLVFVFLLLILPHSAHAYIDPGTGSMAFQALVAGLLGAFFTVKMYWISIKKKLSERFGKREKPHENDGK